MKRGSGDQVTYGEKVPERETQALAALRESLPKRQRGRFLALTRGTETLEEESTPLWKWLLECT